LFLFWKKKIDKKGWRVVFILEIDGFILKMEGEWKIERKDEELFLFWKWMEGERLESEIHFI
jgi:hypothetical protein